MLKLQVIGNLGKDCVVNTVNGKNVINFSVAHTEKFRDATGNQKDKTIWVECAWWTDKLNISNYLKRGTSIYVEGNPDVRTYQTSDGRQGASLSMRVISVQLLGSSQNNSTNQQTQQQPQYYSGYGQQQTSVSQNTGYDVPVDDDLPF